VSTTADTGAKFLDAARAGDVAALGALLSEDPVVLNYRNELGQSAVMLAMYHRKPEAVKFLLEREPELTLHEACATGQLDRVQALLETPSQRGRLMDQHSGDGFTPLALACFFGQEPVAAWLVEHGANVSLAANNPMQVAPVHAATAGRHFGILKLLVEAGANVNARQQQGFTPLHAAAQQGDEASLRLLLEHGADRAAMASNQQTALDLALQNGHGGAVAILEA
jgi:ankyrin repeat protein